MNDSNLLATYPPFNTKLLNGNDVFLYDDKGNEYLDCLAGIAVVSLGHANVEIANVIAEQSKKLIHVSNYFENEYTQSVASKINEKITLTFEDTKTKSRFNQEIKAPVTALGGGNAAMPMKPAMEHKP